MITQEIFVVDATRTPKVQRLVEEKVAAAKCLCCDAKPHRLGLCTHHYYRYRTELGKLGPRAAAKYVAQLRKSGLLLKPNEVLQIKRKDDAFTECASQLNN